MTTAAEDKQIDYVEEVFSFYQTQRRPIEEKIVRSLKCYRAWDDEYKQYEALYGDQGWRSTIYWPIAYANVETLTPKIAMALAGDPDFFQLQPSEESDVNKVDGLTVLTMRQWDEMRGFDEIINAAKGMQLNGFVWGKYGWLYEDMVQEIRKPLLSIGGIRIGHTMQKKRIIIENRPEFRTLPPERIYWDPYAYKMQDCHLIIDRYFVTKSYALAMAKLGEWQNVGNIDFALTPALSEELEYTRKQLHGEFQLPDSGGEAVTNEFMKRCEILECYGIDEKNQKRRKFVVANRATRLFNDNIPFGMGRPPFIYGKNSHTAGRMVGDTEMEYAEPFNRAINRLRNAHIENIEMKVHGMWKVSRFADVDKNDLVARPWGVVETNDMEGVEPLETPPLDDHANAFAIQLSADVQTFSGIVDFLKGVPAPGFSETASGIERLVSAATTRFAARIKSAQENIIKELIQQMITLSVQNLGPEVAVRIAGKRGLQFSKLKLDNIHGSFDVMVKTSNEVVAKAVANQQLLILYNLFRGDPEIDQRSLKKLVITRMAPGAEGQLLTNAMDELTSDEENLIIASGGFAVPLPNDDHNEHIQTHTAYMQDHVDELDDSALATFQQHLKDHATILRSVYQPLGGAMATQPGQVPQGNDMVNPSASGVGASANLGDMMSAAGGASAPQRPA